MQLKRIIATSLLCMFIVSCASQQVAITATSTYAPLVTMTPLSTVTATLYPTRTPLITATPAQFDSDAQDIREAINQYYEISQCVSNLMNPQLDQWLNQPADKPVFLDFTNQFDFDNVIIEEIADSLNNRYRAYVLMEPRPECGENCYQSRIFVKDLSTNQILRIDWGGYMAWRFIYGAAWFGETILTFKQSINPYMTEVVSVDIGEQDYIYHISYASKDTCPLETPNE